MRKDDKIALLRRLLANVQANAGERLGPRAGDGIAQAPELDVETRLTPARLGRDPIDSWTSLDDAPEPLPELPPASRGFSNTLRPPPFSPELVALAGPPLDLEPPPIEFAEPELAETELSLEEADDSIAEIIAREATESAEATEVAEAIETAEQAHAFAAAEFEAPFEQDRDEMPPPEVPSVAPPSEPRSEIARALRRATEPSFERRDPRAMWEDAAFDLRERRPTSPPIEDEPDPPPPASFAMRPPASSAPTSIVPMPPLLPVSSEPPGPATLRRRRRPFRTIRWRGRDGRSLLRRTWIGASIVLAIGAAALAFSFGRVRTADPPREPERAMNAPEPAQIRTAATPDPSPRVATTSAPSSTAAAEPTASETAAASVRPPVPDTKRLTDDRAYLYVEAPRDRQVYVNGILAGDADAWLEVGCGFRWMRLADRGPSAGGRSFPVWSSEGVSIVIPCRGATSIDMR